MKFHTDEHIPRAVTLGLKRRGIDVTATSDANLLGRSDEEHLTYCRREGRVMVTHDPDFLRLAASAPDHAGIAYCHGRKYKPGMLLSRLLRLAGRVPDFRNARPDRIPMTCG
jgi:hypothetical protein